ncbi:MAG: hypothetical protein AAF519_06220 [Bacteroidota bacterium]
MKEKDVDKLFQDAAKRASIGNANEGWASMEAKLKGAGMVAGTKPKSWISLNVLWIILLLLIGGGGIYWYVSTSESDQNNTKMLADDSITSLEESGTKSTSNTQDDLGGQTGEQASDEENKGDLYIEQTIDSQSLKISAPSKDEASIKTEIQANESSEINVARIASETATAENDALNKNASSSSDKEILSAAISGPEADSERNVTSRASERADKVDSGLNLNNDMIENSDFEDQPGLIQNESFEPNGSLIEEKPSNKQRRDSEAGVLALSSDDVSNVQREANPSSVQRSDSTYFAGPVLLLPISAALDFSLQLPDPQIDQINDPPAKDQEEPAKDSLFRRSKWSIGLEISPDLSTVGLRGAEDPGYTVGLLLERHFTSKLSLSAGVSYSKKIYFADEGIESYPGTNPNWTLDRVDANCDVIDVPINLSYYLKGYEQSGLVFGVGLSTYFMLTENYDIIYDDPWPEGTQFFRSENQHFFGILNASIGYRKRLNSSLSLQAEPYLKIPVQGIGAGDLDLYTSGLRLTLKYNRASNR